MLASPCLAVLFVPSFSSSFDVSRSGSRRATSRPRKRLRSGRDVPHPPLALKAKRKGRAVPNAVPTDFRSVSRRTVSRLPRGAAYCPNARGGAFLWAMPCVPSIVRLIGWLLQSEIAQGRVIVGATAKRPVVLALALLDRDIIDAGDAKPHQAVLIKFPVLVAVAAEPITAVVVPLICKARENAVLTEGPHFLDQPVVQLAVPLARKKSLDGLAALQKFSAVPPAAVGRVGERDARGITGIPCIFGLACFLRSSLGGEGRKRRSVHGLVSIYGFCEALPATLEGGRQHGSFPRPSATCGSAPI